MNLSNLDVMEIIIELLQNLSVISIVTVFCLHKYPYIIPQKHSAGSYKGAAFFSILALTAMALTYKTQGLVFDIRIAPIILAAVYLGVREGLIVALCTIIFRSAIGGPGWIPWAVIAPLSVPMSIFVMRWFSAQNHILGLIVTVVMNTLLNFLVFVLFATYFSDGVYSFYVQPMKLINIYLPLLVGNIASTTLLDWVFRYLTQIRDLHKQEYAHLESRVRERTAQLANMNQELEQEIVERKLAEERYRMLFNSIKDALFVWHFQEVDNPGQFIEVNDVACQRLGYTRDELIKLSPHQINHTIGKPASTAVMKKMLNDKQAFFETEHITKDGTMIPVEVNASVFELNGRLVVTSIVRDITLRKQTEAELFYARERNAKIEKLTFLGTIAAGIAHEINQPLNTIKVTADSMLLWAEEGQSYDWEEFIEDIQMISRQSERAAGIIRYIRDVIRINQQMKRHFFNVNNAICNSLKLIKPQLADSRVNVTTELDPELPQIYGSSTYMEHALINLMTNGMQAIEAASKSEKRLHIKTWFDGSIAIQVADSGIGISDNTKDKIFDIFFSTKPEGMGMGLAIVQSVVSNQGGTIEATSNNWGGATFTIRIPLQNVDEDKGGE